MLRVIANEANTMPQVNVKATAHQLIDQLPEDASWDKVLYTFQIRRDIDAGMVDIEAGRVIDGERVMEWVDSWGTDNEQEPPSL